MNTIALVFFTLSIHNPSVYTGPEFSDRLFESHNECAKFVNTIAGQDVVDSNYEFQFASLDGLLFKGGCYTASEYKEVFKNYGLES